MEQCVSEFIEFLSVERSASSNTINAYKSDLIQLLDYVAPHRNGSLDWHKISPTVVQDYVIHLKSKSYAEATLARKVAAVKSFFSFLQAEGTL